MTDHAYVPESILNTPVHDVSCDAVFIGSPGTISPCKHIALGLGLETLTGSKKVLNMLILLGHSISYDEIKRSETEIIHVLLLKRRL